MHVSMANAIGARIPVAAFTAVGCYIDSASSIRALSNVTYSDQNTLQHCASQAADSGAVFFGVANGNECWSGDVFNIQSFFTEDSDCSFPCPGDSLQQCGALDRLRVFRFEEKNAQLVQVERRAVADTCVCTSTSSSTSSLTSSRSTTSTISASMSTTSSSSSSKSSSSSSSIVTSSTVTSTSSTTTSRTSSATSAVASSYLGCFTDNVNGRAFPVANTFHYNAEMYIESCYQTAARQNASFFGLEYGQECWWGNSIDGGNGPAPESDCNAPCSGENGHYPHDICGGSNRLSMYKVGAYDSPGNGTAMGCYYDNVNGYRALAFQYTNSKMTVELCARRAAFANAPYFGLEYGVECWYGYSINYNDRPSVASDCNVPCGGNRSQTCGAGNRLSMYKLSSLVTT